jgi:hypothetical protein
MAAWFFLAVPPASAGSLTDWSLSPVSGGFDDWTATLEGTASGALYAGSGAGLDRTGVTGSLLLLPRLRRDFDNGWELGLHAAILAHHDALSGDSYGDRVFEKFYVSLDTQYGRFELGQQDGAAYQLAVTGPKVDATASLDDANVSFHRDPATGRAFVDLFPLRVAEFATANDAKFSYFSPVLYGLEFAASFTPRDVRGGLPFVAADPDTADRQSGLAEAALGYTTALGPATVTAYAGGVLGQITDRMPDHEGLRDWAIGGGVDVPLDTLKLSFGGAWRQSNAYTFDIADAFADGALTRGARLSASLTSGPWIAGVEYAIARADQAGTLPSLAQTGYEPSLAYVFNSNLQLTLGWQMQHFMRSSGTFFNGDQSVDLSALFLHAALHV